MCALITDETAIVLEAESNDSDIASQIAKKEIMLCINERRIPSKELKFEIIPCFLFVYLHQEQNFIRIPYCYFDTELEARKSDLDNYFRSKLNKNSANQDLFRGFLNAFQASNAILDYQRFCQLFCKLQLTSVDTHFKICITKYIVCSFDTRNTMILLSYHFLIYSSKQKNAINCRN